ncbi:MAG TPA: hypothetical protein VD769_09425 [Gaiellaceae bacterium]|nr:hypothetical protein [Gaiellaceae bacterium]
MRPSLVAALAVALLAGPAAAGAQPQAERELVRRYAPVMMLKVNPEPPCSRRGEQYVPSPVTITLGNPEVHLLRPRSRGGYEQTTRLATAPAATALAGRGPDYYLNLPGHPRRPGCTYARASARLMDGRRSVIYAHVAREPGVRGLALQYWFYYWFNQFNDLHESDWEMIQVAFDAATPEEALARGPSQLAYAQHEGGERRDWDDPRVEKEGTHPVVYVSSGSHASQYWSALFLGNGRRGSGLGCDDTRGPSRAIRPTPILVSTYPAFDSRDAWLTYRGHWGQHEPGVSNGPTGPNTKRQWLEPFRWMASLRTSTPTVPTSDAIGAPVTGAFCGTVSTLSSFLNDTSSSPLALLLGFAAIAATLAIPALRTRWRPVVATPLRERRAGGQIVDAAGRVYWEHRRVLLPVGLVAVPLGAAAVGAQALLFHTTGLRRAFDALEDDKVEGFVALLVGVLTHGLAPILVGAAATLVLREVDRGGEAGLGAVARGLRGELWRLVGLGLAALLLVFLLVLTVIGIPFAVKKAVDWAFVQQAAGFEGRRGRAAFSGSTRLVRGHWWRAAVICFVLLLLLALTGPFVGVLVILVTDTPLATINLFAALLFAVVLPFVSTALTLLYLDLAARRDREEPAAGMLPAP